MYSDLEYVPTFFSFFVQFAYIIDVILIYW